MLLHIDTTAWQKGKRFAVLYDAYGMEPLVLCFTTTYKRARICQWFHTDTKIAVLLPV